MLVDEGFLANDAGGRRIFGERCRIKQKGQYEEISLPDIGWEGFFYGSLNGV
jgi:hypothetical protein